MIQRFKCRECGGEMVDLGDFDPSRFEQWACRQVVAYAFELARRGDDRLVTHDLMREDGERWLKVMMP